MTQAAKSRTAGLICAGLVLATVAAFWPVFHAEFVNFDDMDYVFENPMVLKGMTWAGVQWSLTAIVSANWHPLTMLSHMLDVQLYGLNATGHHFTNLLLHSLNTLLVFALLRNTTGALWRSAFVAALFALHPTHVESVAWVAERKDVLSTFFGLLTLIAYARYVNDSKLNGAKAKGWYGAALLCFALGLMSKPMLVTWPFVLLLLDHWPLARTPKVEKGKWLPAVAGWRPLIIEKLPFFALTIASSAITFLSQHRAGATTGLHALSLGERAGNALVAYARYLGKNLWPTDLAAYYPHPLNWPTAYVASAAVLLIVVSGAVLWFTPRRRYLFTGWFWFVGTLVPVIGLVQVGSQSLADRYNYIPSLGLMIALVWLGAEILSRLALNTRWIAAGSLGLLALLGAMTHRQAGYWKDSETLFTHTLAVTDEGQMAYFHIGNFMAHFCLGNSLIEKGKLPEGRVHLERAREMNPTLPVIHGALASLANREGRYADAIAGYEEALKHPPTSPEVLNNLAWLLTTCPDPQFRDGTKAVQLAEQACTLTRYEKAVHIGTLAAAYAEVGRFAEAITTAQRAHDQAVRWGDQKIARRNLELMELYKAGKAFHEERPQ